MLLSKNVSQFGACLSGSSPSNILGIITFNRFHNLVVKAHRVGCIVFQDCQLHTSATT